MNGRLCLVLLLTFGALKSYCQKTPEDYFREGRIAEIEGHYSTALKDFLFVVDKHPTSMFCSCAFFFIGKIYDKQGENRNAIAAYQAAIKMKSTENTLFTCACPFDHKREAAHSLSNMYELMGQYDSALYFLGQYDSVYTTVYGCNYEAAGNENAIIMQYTNIYLKANRIKDAEHVLLARSVFKPYEYKDGIAKMLDELFRKYEQPNALKSEIETAVSNYYFDTVSYGSGKTENTFVYCCINFLGAKVRYYFSGPPWEPSNFWAGAATAGLSEKEKIVAALKKSDLYTIIRRM